MPGDDERIDEAEASQLLEEAANFIEDYPQEEEKIVEVEEEPVHLEDDSALLEEEPLDTIEDTQSEPEKSPFEEVNCIFIVWRQWRSERLGMLWNLRK